MLIESFADSTKSTSGNVKIAASDKSSVPLWVIVYNLHKDSNDEKGNREERYRNLLDYIKSYDNTFISESCYSVATNDSIQTIWDNIKEIISIKDQAVVFPFISPILGRHNLAFQRYVLKYFHGLGR